MDDVLLFPMAVGRTWGSSKDGWSRMPSTLQALSLSTVPLKCWLLSFKKKSHGEKVSEVQGTYSHKITVTRRRGGDQRGGER